MSSNTVEVELENGYIKAIGNGKLPVKGRGYLTLIDSGKAQTCAELAEHWEKIPRLAPEEAVSFGEDIESAKKELKPPFNTWDSY